MPGTCAGSLYVALATAVAAFSVCTPQAGAIVVDPTQSWNVNIQGFVGRINGSSAVAIGERWIATVPHVGASVGATFTMNGVSYTTVNRIQHSTGDLVLYELNDDLPGWHLISEGARGLEEIVIGGYGYTRGNSVSNGYAWTNPRELTWGANTIESLGSRIGTRFDAPTDDRSVPGEAGLAEFDSGGGLFTIADDGSLELAGLGSAVSGDFTSTRYGNWSYFTNLESLRGWIIAIVSPGTPTTSSYIVERNIPGGDVPEPAGAAALMLVGAGMLGRRRR